MNAAHFSCKLKKTRPTGSKFPPFSEIAANFRMSKTYPWTILSALEIPTVSEAWLEAETGVSENPVDKSYNTQLVA